MNREGSCEGPARKALGLPAQGQVLVFQVFVLVLVLSGVESMNSGLDRIVANREDAHRVMNAAYGMAKQLLADGKPVHIQVSQHEDDRSLRANAYYWGCALPCISSQAMLEGQRWTVDAWHELFRRQFLGYEVKRLVVAGKKKKLVIRRLRSTATLKVRAFSKYLDELTAFAVTDLGVRFPVASWEHWSDAGHREAA